MLTQKVQTSQSMWVLLKLWRYETLQMQIKINHQYPNILLNVMEHLKKNT